METSLELTFAVPLQEAGVIYPRLVVSHTVAKE